MEVTRSANALRRISSALRVIAWLVFALFLSVAVTTAKLISSIPVVGDTAVSPTAAALTNILPVSGITGGVIFLVLGVAALAVLLGLAEVFQLVVAIEDNTRRAAEGTGSKAAPREKVAAG